MADPWAIVLVPTEAGRGLLATTHIDDLSVVAPCVYWDDDRSWTEHWPGRCGVEALPIWWAGALVPEGWDRARRVLHDLVPAVPAGSGWPTQINPATLFNPRVADVSAVADALYISGLCRVVVLNEVDGRIVERGP